MDYSLSYGHHGLRPCSTHLGEGTVSMGQATGPIYTHVRPPDTRPDAVPDAHPERRQGTVSGQSAPNPMRCLSSCCQPSLSSPLDGMQANGKPLVSSTHAQTTTMVHGPDGPTRGRAEATRVCVAGVKSEALRQVSATHEAP